MKTTKDFYLIPTPPVEDLTLPELITYLIPKPGGSLLDIGCFDGSKTSLYWKITQSETAWGVDFIPDKLAEAKGRGIQTLDVDLNSGLPLDFPPESFDIITCIEVVEHVYSPDDLIDEMVRLLKPNGYILLTTPNLASWKNRFVLLLGWQPFLSEVSTRVRYGNPLADPGQPVGHIRLFTLNSLLEMAAAAGLITVRMGGLALKSPQKNLVGTFSRLGDALLSRFPSLADRLVIRLEKT